MTRFTIRLVALFTSVSFACSISAAQAKQSTTKLQATSSLERTLEPNDSHDYTIALTEGQYVSFTVVQRGVDVVVRAFSPLGKNVGEFDSPNGGDGPENGGFVAITEGEYKIVVAPLDPEGTANRGKYEIKIIEIRDATEQELRVGKSEGDRKAKGLALLKELVDSLPEIRQPQTRMRLKMECAHLLWDIDEKKAAMLLTEVVGESQAYSEGVKGESPDFEEVWQWASQFRYEAIQTLASHDPEAAISLLRSTSKPSKGDYPGSPREQEAEFEMTVVSQLAKKNPKRAFELAQESLKKDYSTTLVQTIQRLRQSDNELASQLAQSIVDKLVSENLAKRSDGIPLTISLLRGFPHRPESSPSQEQLISNELRKKLLQKVIDEVKSIDSSTDMFSSMEGSQAVNLLSQVNTLGNHVDTIIPGATSVLNKKIEELAVKNPALRQWSSSSNTSSAEEFTISESLEELPEYARSQMASVMAQKSMQNGDFASAKQAIEQMGLDPRTRQRMIDQLEYQTAVFEASHGRMEEALRHAAKLPSVRERSMVISEIAGRIGPGYKSSVAIALLEQARGLIGPELYSADQFQMRARLEIAVRLASYEAKRGFELVDPIVDQFNELAEAAKKLDGFGVTFFVAGELSTVNGNGLQSIASGLTLAIGHLCIQDFDRAKGTANRIGLPEVKLVAYMAIAKQAISPKTLYSPSASYMNMRNR